jgi:hypothetical protein
MSKTGLIYFLLFLSHKTDLSYDLCFVPRLACASSNNFQTVSQIERWESGNLDLADLKVFDEPGVVTGLLLVCMQLRTNKPHISPRLSDLPIKINRHH